MSKPILTQQYLKEIIHYNPKTGLFKWTSEKKYANSHTIGYTNPYGYHSIMIDGRNFPAHRLAWLYVYGIFPPNQVDHINHDKLDNRISNLRAVTNQDNQRNRRFTGNSSGFMGVYWDKARSKWKTQIKVNQVVVNLGRYDDITEAISMRLTAEDHYGFHSNHGIVLTK